MMNYRELKNHLQKFLDMTSLTPEEFEKLLPSFTKAWNEYQAEQTNKRKSKRKRKKGGGRKGRIEKPEDKLLFVLVYHKTYPLQVVHGELFGMSQPQASYWIHVLSPILQKALAYEKKLPSRSPHDFAENPNNCDTRNYQIDATERRRQRPKDKKKQKEYYSGKKKAHTYKNNAITNATNRKVVYLSKTVPGKTHDKKLCDQEDIRFPVNSLLEKDTGYQGYEPDGAITFQGKKKPRNGELSAEEKFINKVYSSTRIVVENVFAGVKRCRVVKDVCRNLKEDFADLVMEIACGLHNFRQEFRHPIKTVNLLTLVQNAYFR